MTRAEFCNFCLISNQICEFKNLIYYRPEISITHVFWLPDISFFWNKIFLISGFALLLLSETGLSIKLPRELETPSGLSTLASYSGSTTRGDISTLGPLLGVTSDRYLVDVIRPHKVGSIWVRHHPSSSDVWYKVLNERAINSRLTHVLHCGETVLLTFIFKIIVS